MGLGENLRKAMEKIRNSGSLDKETVKEVTKEIQRALISSDVQVELVLQLTKKIEETAFKDLPAGINRREFITKNTYDILAEALGSGKKLEKVPERILMLGLFGAGKCVHPSTKIPLANGEIKSIEEIYDETEEQGKEIPEGFVKEINPKEVFSFNPLNLKIVKGKATHLWKLKKTNPLIKISVDNGNNHSITTTPEHPFFVLENGEIKQVRASNLKVNQHIATPKKLNFEEKEYLKEKIFESKLNLKVIDKELSKKVKQEILSKFGALINWYKEKKRGFAFCTISHELKHGIVRQELIKEFKLVNELKQTIKIYQSFSHSRKIYFPLNLTPELTEFLGYIYGDGHLRKQYLEVSNENKQIKKRIELLSKSLFGLKAISKKDKRSKNLYNIRISSILLVELLNKLFGLPINKKSDKIFIPKILLNSEKEAKKTFLRAYFDCDGFADKNRSIEFVTASKEFSIGLRHLLLDLEMYSTFSKKEVNEKEYYRIMLKSKDTEKFAEEIGSIVEFKKNRLKKYKEIGKKQSFGKHEVIPVGLLCRDVREAFGATIGEIQKYVSSFGIYEHKGMITRESLKKFLNAVNKTKNKNNDILELSEKGIPLNELKGTMNETKGWLNACVFRLKELGLVEYENQIITTTKQGMILLQEHKEFNYEKVKMLELLSESDIIWQKVNKIELDESAEFVYDLTVEDYHNFVANEIIVHNTTTTGKLAKYYSKRGKKVGLICADTFRPAAYEQLKQLSEKIELPFFGIDGEKNAAKVVKEGMKKFKGFDLIIVDSAGRSALDKELVKEIKEINKELNPDFSLLVLGADIGQIAGKQAKAFHESVGVNGVIITKMDGSAKGGGALIACSVTDAPVYFIGTGEKMNDLEEFDATRYLSRVMGYGDLQGLLEKVKEATQDEEVDLEELMEKEFNLDIFYKQLKAARKMGPLNKVMDMMGMGQQIPKEQMQLGEEKLDAFKVIMDSMTKKEKEEPEVLSHSRIQRIAKGSGKKEEEVRELIKHYKKMKKMFKQMKKFSDPKMLEKKGALDKLMKKFSKQKKVKFR